MEKSSSTKEGLMVLDMTQYLFQMDIIKHLLN